MLSPRHKTDLVSELIRHEGFRKHPYKCTAGVWTIGVGRNLEEVGITKAEAMMLLENDVATYQAAAKSFVGDEEAWALMGEERQAVVINMAFNLGATRLGYFKNFRKALLERNYVAAAKEMLDSRWAKQVGGRSGELALRMETGRWN